MDILNADYWDSRYQTSQTGWDIGYPSPAIVSYFERLKDKNSALLIPGCGNAYEGEAIHNMGFTNLTLLDYAENSKRNFLERVSGFSENNFITGDFFEHKGSYDIIVEQTFFCALNPDLRSMYVDSMHELLAPGGKIVGLMFNIPLFEDHPPFGGNETDYRKLFEAKFKIQQMDVSQYSIPSRAGNELFIELIKK
jgi:methyl halide transferase